MPVRRRLMLILLVLATALITYLWRAQVLLLVRLLLGGGTVAYLFYPVSQWFQKKFRIGRVLSILCSFLCAALVVSAAALLLLPPLVRQMRDIISAAPAFFGSVRSQFQSFNASLSGLGLSRLSLPELNLDRMISSLPPLLGGTASFAGSIVSAFTEWTLSFMLGYYILRDRERVLLRLELLVPSAFRKTALCIVSDVHREITSFLRGQLLISLIVAGLSAFALMLAGVRSFLALGLIVGLFNMIPYFGPLLGAVPAVLMALSQGLPTALLAAFSLFAVQQLDSIFISPRIMGALTGLHPGTVLLAITLGSSLSGILGMLLAIPSALAVRAIFRVLAARKAAV
ncbi:MAG: AI-2E family transporter [Clostridia bacterium]|nr:AI-2E family transporter [Clostridia bacterium]